VAKGREKSEKVKIWQPLKGGKAKTDASWLRRQERRNPENTIVRRWFGLADKMLGRKHDHRDEQ